jgi:hypothetical protein
VDKDAKDYPDDIAASVQVRNWHTSLLPWER